MPVSNEPRGSSAGEQANRLIVASVPRESINMELFSPRRITGSTPVTSSSGSCKNKRRKRCCWLRSGSWTLMNRTRSAEELKVQRRCFVNRTAIIRDYIDSITIRRIIMVDDLRNHDRS
ncbi:uncharacterized protein LOC143207993 isoform X1 [Lasioglossum baleicum]|uniref:uncharacterized protein LOC143207993 isoform X1 n=1 Tax=Lasioglossum baleicum TaxID=434251 RepID=UPI003FCD23C1